MTDLLHGILQATLAIGVWELLKSVTGPNRHRWECSEKDCGFKAASNSKEVVAEVKGIHVNEHRERESGG